MKRLPLILTVALVLLLSGIAILYNYYLNRSSTGIWEVIPGTALAVYEIGECSECIEGTRNTSFWKTISQVLAPRQKEDSLGSLFAFMQDPKNKGAVSLHITEKDNFDFVYYLTKGRAEVLFSQVPALRNGASQREFNEVQIYEKDFKHDAFSWVIIDDIWVGSRTPFLVEDVIRTYKSGKIDTFTDNFSEAVNLPRVRNDAGNLYVNLVLFDELYSVFLEKDYSFQKAGKAALLDVKSDDRSLSLNGFSLSNSEDRNSLLSRFSGQSPMPFSHKRYISNRSLAVTSYGVSNGVLLFNQLNISGNKAIQDSIVSLAKVNFEELFSALGKEMSICLFESRGLKLSKVLLFDVTDPSGWLSALDRLSKATEKEDTLFYERYSTYEIREIELKRLPEKLFGPLVNGFDQVYFSHTGNTILVADQLEELRRFMDDIDREDVWGKSVYYNQFLESTLLESNVAIYINAPRALHAISKRFNAKWSRTYTETSRDLDRTLGLSALQFSNLNESFYTNLLIAFNPSVQIGERQQAAGPRVQSAIDQTIVTAPYLVKNHTSKIDDVVVQDSLNTIHYFSPDGKRQWKRDIQDRIVGKVHQVDYLNNNKLQLFFATPDRLHVIDRLGNYVSPFPVANTQKDVEYVSVVDYDNSKKYRFLMADRSGKLWLTDKEGRLLDGWKPRSTDGQLFTTPNHHRIRGKDFVLAIRRDGWAYLMNRRGENIKGFPLNLEIRPGGDYFLEVGSTLASSHFVVVSRDGVKVKFNVEGQVLSKEPLIKTGVEDQFSLVTETTRKAYLVMRQNPRQLTLLDENGNVILTNDFVGANRANVQYYDFGTGKVYVLIVDEIQELCYLYDGQGNLLTPVPIEGSGAALRYEAGNVTMVTVHGTALAFQAVPN